MAADTLPIAFRSATIDDLPAILLLLAEDVLGAQRESLEGPARVRYEAAFRAIHAQQGNQILLGVRGDEVVAMLQLTFIPGLSHRGATRAQIESVRVRDAVRGQGVGKLLFREAIELSRQAGCAMVQLTTDRRREDALRFYESLGFEATHWGMKLPIGDSTA
jgi:ribosomal protein S18 acetylase RimI-like enzyme